MIICENEDFMFNYLSKTNYQMMYKLFLCTLVMGFIVSCSDKKKTTTTTSTTHSVIIYYKANGKGNAGLENSCYGTDSDGYTHAPFYSISAHNLKDRLPSTYHSAAVYSLQGWKISDSWDDLWDGTIDSTLFEAEVDNDNTTAVIDTSYTGWWSGTLDNGTYGGYSCSDWTSGSNSVYGVAGSYNQDNSSWVNTVDGECGRSRDLLCFQYK